MIRAYADELYERWYDALRIPYLVSPDCAQARALRVLDTLHDRQ